MITGAARADVAVVVIGADEGVRAQSRRHGKLLSLLGVRDVIVAVNKLTRARKEITSQNIFGTESDITAAQRANRNSHRRA